jgi:hypothetical protein
MHPTARSLVAGVAVVLAAAVGGVAVAQAPGDPLAESFLNPPEAARPRTWWHWTRGHVTLKGITKDLEWMHRVGIGGVQLADVNFGGGQEIDAPLDFGSPGWLEAVRHAAAESERLGLEMAIFSSSGWSLTGGPWVQPHQAMKKLVWSKTVVEGPRAVSVKLPQPPSNNGSFRDMGAGRPSRDPTYYGDSAVIAYRAPADERAWPKRGRPSPPVAGRSTAARSTTTAMPRRSRWSSPPAERGWRPRGRPDPRRGPVRQRVVRAAHQFCRARG